MGHSVVYLVDNRSEVAQRSDGSADVSRLTAQLRAVEGLQSRVTKRLLSSNSQLRPAASPAFVVPISGTLRQTDNARHYELSADSTSDELHSACEAVEPSAAAQQPISHLLRTAMARSAALLRGNSRNNASGDAGSTSGGDGVDQNDMHLQEGELHVFLGTESARAAMASGLTPKSSGGDGFLLQSRGPFILHMYSWADDDDDDEDSNESSAVGDSEPNAAGELLERLSRCCLSDERCLWPNACEFCGSWTQVPLSSCLLVSAGLGTSSLIPTQNPRRRLLVGAGPDRPAAVVGGSAPTATDSRPTAPADLSTATGGCVSQERIALRANLYESVRSRPKQNTGSTSRDAATRPSEVQGIVYVANGSEPADASSSGKSGGTRSSATTARAVMQAIALLGRPIAWVKAGRLLKTTRGTGSVSGAWQAAPRAGSRTVLKPDGLTEGCLSLWLLADGSLQLIWSPLPPHTGRAASASGTGLGQAPFLMWMSNAERLHQRHVADAPPWGLAGDSAKSIVLGSSGPSQRSAPNHSGQPAGQDSGVESQQERSNVNLCIESSLAGDASSRAFAVVAGRGAGSHTRFFWLQGRLESSQEGLRALSQQLKVSQDGPAFHNLVQQTSPVLNVLLDAIRASPHGQHYLSQLPSQATHKLMLASQASSAQSYPSLPSAAALGPRPAARRRATLQAGQGSVAGHGKQICQTHRRPTTAEAVPKPSGLYDTRQPASVASQRGLNKPQTSLLAQPLPSAVRSVPSREPLAASGRLSRRFESDRCVSSQMQSQCAAPANVQACASRPRVQAADAMLTKQQADRSSSVTKRRERPAMARKGRQRPPGPPPQGAKEIITLDNLWKYLK